MKTQIRITALYVFICTYVGAQAFAQSTQPLTDEQLRKHRQVYEQHKRLMNSDEMRRIRLMYRNDVQKELELIEDQLGAVTRGNEQTQRKMDEIAKRVASAAGSGRIAESIPLMRQLAEEKARARQELLLPHQLRRLDELLWRYRSTSEPVKTFDVAVGLSEQQRDRMLVTAQKLRRELLDKLWKFHRRSQREILEILTPAQRMEWNKNIGEEFRFNSSFPNLRFLQYIR